MISNIGQMLVWTARLLSVAVFLQTAELLRGSFAWKDDGFYPWDLARENLPGPLRAFFDSIMRERVFRRLLFIQIFFAICLFIMPNVVAGLGLVLTLWIVAQRWSGSYNGANDHMTFLIALGIFLAEGFPRLRQVGLGYIAIQLILSYSLSGIHKLRSKKWRNGEGLREVLELAIYHLPLTVVRLSKNKKTVLYLSWSIIIFEIFFPIALISQSACILMMSIALCFHLFNFYCLGLNRFVFAWLAAYPALMWLTKWLHFSLS